MARTLDARAALASAMAATTNTPSACAATVDRAFGYPGNADGHSYPTAYSFWQNAPDEFKHPGDYDAPAGAVLVFGPSPTRTDKNKNAGDTGLATGAVGGAGRFSDGNGEGRMGTMTIAARAKQTARPYLGYIMGYYCGFPVSNYGPKPSGAPAPTSGLMKISQPGVTVKMVQDRLLAHGISVGPTGADNKNGPNTTAALGIFQTQVNLLRDLDVGSKTWAALSANAAPEPTHPPFPLPASSFFGPEGGSAQSVSGYHGHSGDLRVWQQRMKDRGWAITVDGLYGPRGAKTPTGNTASIAGAFQKEKGLVVDKKIGQQTWDAAWTSPVT